MKSIERLVVFIDQYDTDLEVGELISSGRNIFFQYHPDFIEKGFQLSPFKLPLSNEIIAGDPTIFEGLFGVFNDSLPDGWGRLLLDRALQSKGYILPDISPLDRLSFVGNRGMGALKYQPESNWKGKGHPLMELDAIASETQKILSGLSSEVIDELFSWGGSSGGARPKILVGYHPGNDHLISGDEQIPPEYENWIIKFSASSDPEDIAEIEYAYYQMALDTGIEMSACRLFQGASGKRYFGTKRFDRNQGKRIHMHSASGLMHDNFRLSNMDYGHLMDAAFRLENHVGAYEKIFRLAAFNVFSHNRDDHSKNFSFLMDHGGNWSLAPAYDLTFSRSSHGQHSTTVAGEGQAPREKHLLNLAHIFPIKKPREIIEQAKEVLSNWRRYARESGVSKNSTELIARTLDQLIHP